MSEDCREVYYHQLFHDDQRGRPDFPYSGGTHSSDFSPADHDSSVHPHLQMFDPNSYLSFTEILHGSTDIDHDAEKAVQPATPNSSTTTSSLEAAAAAAGEEDSKKGKKGISQEDSSMNEANKSKKKGEKKEKQPRFAFMTKSDVDQLEDGYRWRKYGQKAVKNSPYPRSYYRCTTQKCGVKKRVERSFQDPSVVITTYEGQHNHHVPANLRGHVAGMFGNSMFAPAMEAARPNFQQELLLQMPHLYGASVNYAYHQQQQQQQQRNLTPHPHHYQQFADYGLLQDIIPPGFPKHES